MQKKRLLVLGAFLVLISIASFVSAQSAIFDPVRDMFANWERGQLSENIAKYVVWMLLLIVVYSILEVTPIFKERNVGLKFLIALFVSFLATAYLTPSDLYIVLSSYTALGIVLSAVIPFVLLLFFSIEVGSKGGAGGVLLSKIMWGAFVVFLIYKVFYGIYGINKIQWTEGWIYVIFIAGAILWIFGVDRWVIANIRKEATYQHKTRYAEETELAAAKTRADAAAVRRESPTKAAEERK